MAAAQHFIAAKQDDQGCKNRLFDSTSGSAQRKESCIKLFGMASDHKNDLLKAGLDFCKHMTSPPQKLKDKLLLTGKDGDDLGSALLFDSLLSDNELTNFLEEDFPCSLFMLCSQEEKNRCIRVSSKWCNTPTMFGNDQSPRFVRADSVTVFETKLLQKANSLAKVVHDSWFKCLSNEHGEHGAMCVRRPWQHWQ